MRVHGYNESECHERAIKFEVFVVVVNVDFIWFDAFCLHCVFKR